MNKRSPAQLEWARQLLTHESATAAEDDGATNAASRVYDKLHAQMVPLVGDAGAQLLFTRSARLTRSEFACFGQVSTASDATTLRECLLALDPAVATDTAAR